VITLVHSLAPFCLLVMLLNLDAHSHRRAAELSIYRDAGMY
jgi:hypothetical protein